MTFSFLFFSLSLQSNFDSPNFNLLLFQSFFNRSIQNFEYNPYYVALGLIASLRFSFRSVLILRVTNGCARINRFLRVYSAKVISFSKLWSGILSRTGVWKLGNPRAKKAALSKGRFYRSLESRCKPFGGIIRWESCTGKNCNRGDTLERLIIRLLNSVTGLVDVFSFFFFSSSPPLLPVRCTEEMTPPRGGIKIYQR